MNGLICCEVDWSKAKAKQKGTDFVPFCFEYPIDLLLNLGIIQ